MASEENRQQIFRSDRGRCLEELDMMMTLFKSNSKGGEILLKQADIHVVKYETIRDEREQPEVLTQDVIQKKECLLQLGDKYKDFSEFR